MLMIHSMPQKRSSKSKSNPSLWNHLQTYEVHSGVGFIVIAFIAGFVAALFFSVSENIVTPLVAQLPAPTQISNQAQAIFKDASGKTYPTVTSNTVLISIKTGTPSGDTTPPGAIVNMGVGSITSNSIPVMWRAPGDDGYVGTATSYDLRYSQTAITQVTEWNAATSVTGEPTPSVVDTKESYTLTSLQSDTTYWIGVRAFDEAGNQSSLSYILKVKTAGTTGGGYVYDPNDVQSFAGTVSSEGNYKKQFSLVRVRLRDATTQQVIAEFEGSSSGTGDITIPLSNIPSKAYHISVRIPKLLSRVEQNITLSPTSSTKIPFINIRLGNLQDGDDEINSLDWAVLSGKWGTADADADFNRDGMVNTLDWGVMNGNWSLKGDETTLFP